MPRRLLMLLSAACAVGAVGAPAAAQARVLTFVRLEEAQLACAFATSCRRAAGESPASIPVAGGARPGVLRTRTMAAEDGAPLAGFVGYEYVVDFRAALAPDDAPCVRAATFPADGELAALGEADEAPPQAYVIDRAGAAGIARMERGAGAVRVVFAGEGVCPGAQNAAARASAAFGFAAPLSPRAAAATLELTDGRALGVRVRAPRS